MQATLFAGGAPFVHCDHAHVSSPATRPQTSLAASFAAPQAMAGANMAVGGFSMLTTENMVDRRNLSLQPRRVEF